MYEPIDNEFKPVSLILNLSLFLIGSVRKSINGIESIFVLLQKIRSTNGMLLCDLLLPLDL